MAHRLSTNSNSGTGPKTIQCSEIGFLSRQKHVMILGFGSAEETEFVEFVIHSGFIEHRCLDEAAGWKADGEAIGASGPIDIVCRFSAAAAGHIFGQDIRLSGNMLFQIG